MSPKIILNEPCGAHVDFIERVRRERIVDTRRYHYMCVNVEWRGNPWEVIVRIPIDYVDTIKMLDEENWTLVKKTLWI